MDLGYKIEKGVYLISPESIEDLTLFVSDLKFILKRSRVKFFQLRLKNVSEQILINAINQIKPVCIKYKTDFILNDDAILASKYACDGLHIGKTDETINAVRKKFQGIIGVSCYNNYNEALKMAQEGANYVSFGAFYPSKTKPSASLCNISVLEDFRKNNKTFPVCVIGGINSKNSKILIESGASLVALSSGVWSIKKNTDRVEELLAINEQFTFHEKN